MRDAVSQSCLEIQDNRGSNQRLVINNFFNQQIYYAKLNKSLLFLLFINICLTEKLKSHSLKKLTKIVDVYICKVIQCVTQFPNRV